MNKNVYKYDDMKRREHMAVRTTAGWYLFTHFLVKVTGRDATAFLDHLFDMPVATVKVGRERYGNFLAENGDIVDDAIIFRTGEDEYVVSTLFSFKLGNWFEAHKGEYEAEWEDITGDWHMFAVQGPKSLELVNAVVANPVDDLRFFAFEDNAIDDFPVIVNRAGFTGEKYGYEIYVPKDKYSLMLEKLEAAGKPLGAERVTEFQVMAWTLPTEAGFYYMRDLMHNNPLEVGLTRGIDWDKDFVGRDALLQIREAGPAREMVAFTLDQDDYRFMSRNLGGPGAPVYKDGHEVARVDKIVWSYVLEKNIGYLLADRGAFKPGDAFAVGEYTGVICEKPFI